MYQFFYSLKEKPEVVFQINHFTDVKNDVQAKALVDDANTTFTDHVHWFSKEK